MDRSQYVFSSVDRGERKFAGLVRFKSAGEFRILAKSDAAHSTASYTFYVSGSSDNNWNPPRYAQVRIESVSDRSPDTHEWVDVALRLENEGAGDRRVEFRVEQYVDGRWRSAYSSDYELARSSYYFSSAESFRRFSSLLKFRTRGEYRLVVDMDRGNTDYQVFTVNYDHNDRWDTHRNDSNPGSISIYSLSPSQPARYEWVDMTLKVYDRAGYLDERYTNSIRLDVDKLEGNYRRRASSADYDLKYTSLRFDRSDRGQKKFDDVIRFRADGEYRIKVSDEANSSVSALRQISIGQSSHTRTDNSNFTDREYRKLKAVYEIWHGVIAALRKDYPKLRNSTLWQQHSDRFYADMGDAIYAHRNAKFTSWSVFYKAFQEWFSLTVRTR